MATEIMTAEQSAAQLAAARREIEALQKQMADLNSSDQPPAPLVINGAYALGPKTTSVEDHKFNPITGVSRKLLERFVTEVMPDTATKPGERINPGVLELVAMEMRTQPSIFNDSCMAEPPYSLPGKPFNYPTPGFNFQNYLTVLKEYQKYPEAWTAETRQIDFGNRPVKKSALKP